MIGKSDGRQPLDLDIEPGWQVVDATWFTRACVCWSASAMSVFGANVT